MTHTSDSARSTSSRAVRAIAFLPCFAVKSTGVALQRLGTVLGVSKRGIRLEEGGPKGPSLLKNIEQEVITPERPTTFVPEGVRRMRKTLGQDEYDQQADYDLNRKLTEADSYGDSDDGEEGQYDPEFSFGDVKAFSSVKSLNIKIDDDEEEEEEEHISELV